MTRYQRAKRKFLFRQRLSILLERFFVWGTKIFYGEEGFKKHGPTHLIAELFFIDCPVCLWWRGFVVGIMLPAIMLVVLSIVVWL